MKEVINNAVTALKRGDLVIFPTETLFGIAADALNITAVEKLFIAKKRPFDLPVPIMIGSMEALKTVAEEIPDCGLSLAKKYWPGPLTLVLRKNDYIPDLVTGGSDKIAVRIPDHEIALEILGKFGSPLAVTSANLSGEPGAEDFNSVREQFMNTVDVIIPGKLKYDEPSTVVDCTSGEPVILRAGALKL